MVTTYRLADDQCTVEAIQRATSNTKDYGIFPTHGLVGSPEWWNALDKGSLQKHTIRGTIVGLPQSGHNDYPLVEVESQNGERSQWARQTTEAAAERHYALGCTIEIDFVRERQQLRGRPGKEATVVLEIRVEHAC